MKIHSAEIQKGMLSLNIEVPADEHQPYLDRAAQDISSHRTIAGFRPGKAPYDVVVREVGQAAVLEAAADEIVSKTYSQAIRDGHYVVVGSPSVRIEMMAPGNALIYTATVPLLPEVTIAEAETLSSESKDVTVTEEEVDRVIEELRQMQSSEAAVNRPAQKSDRVVVDLSMKLDNVPVEGGTAKDHSMILDKPYFVTGLPEKIVGLPIGEDHTFTLQFPEEHYQKHLAGKNVDFTVNVKNVFERTLPPADDAMASRLGQSNLQALRDLLSKNILADKTQKEHDRHERALLEELVKHSAFGDIPETLITQEAWRMMEELEDNVRRKGGEFQAYLDSIKKTKDQLYVDFAPQALMRVKTALLMRAIAERESITVSSEEVDTAIEEAREQYKNDQEVRERINSAEMRDYATTMIRNRKVAEWITAHAKPRAQTASA